MTERRYDPNNPKRIVPAAKPRRVVLPGPVLDYQSKLTQKGTIMIDFKIANTFSGAKCGQGPQCQIIL